MRRKIYKTLLSFLMVMVMILQVVSTAVVAEGNKKEVDATITNFRLESPKGKRLQSLINTMHFILQWIGKWIMNMKY